jgi:carboxyl-terminal processing protease
MTPKAFSDRISAVIDILVNSYYIEIDRGQYLRWAVDGLFERRAGNRFIKPLPSEISQRLAKRDAFSKEECRTLLLDVANILDDDLRWCADIAMERMLRHLDGRTTVVDSDGAHIHYANFVEIGTHLGSDRKSGLVRVAYPFRDGPAYAAGVRSGDLITEITRTTDHLGKPAIKVIPTRGLSLTKVDDALSGLKDTHVILTVQREGVAGRLEFKVPRAAAEEERVFGVHRTKEDRWDHWLDAERKIGYVRISGFREKTHKEIRNVVAALHIQGLKGLIVDLRSNWGGYVHTGTQTAEMFVGDAPLYIARCRHMGESGFDAKPAKAYDGFSMVCLINRETERIAEVLAASLQDNHRAVIIGERSAGNAYISHIYYADPYLWTKVTGCIYFRPNGKKLDRIHPPGQPSDEWGVTPDKGYELILSHKERNEQRAHFEKQLEIWPAGHLKREIPKFKDRPVDVALEYLSKQAGQFPRSNPQPRITAAELRESLNRFRAAGGKAEWLEEKEGHLIIRRSDRPRERVALSRLLVPASVKQLTLAGYDFDDDDLKTVSRWTHLERLDLIHCQDVTGAGIEHLRSLTKLKRLLLSDTKIKSEGVQHLDAFRELEHLEIQHNRLQDDAIEEIQGLPKLSRVVLHGTGISPAAVARLRTALPKCKVVYLE